MKLKGTAKKLETWMRKTGLGSLSVAEALSLDPRTVTRFLGGETIHKSTEAAFARLIETKPKSYKK